MSCLQGAWGINLRIQISKRSVNFNIAETLLTFTEGILKRKSGEAEREREREDILM